MISKTTHIVALAATASAAIDSVQVVHIIESLKSEGLPVKASVHFSDNKNDARALFARDDPTYMECAASLRDVFETIPTPTNREVLYWFTDVLETAECTLTAHSSLSDDIMSYVTELIDWIWEIEDGLEKIVDDCGDQLGIEINDNSPADLLCGKGGTMIYTGSANATATVAFETALADYTPPASGASHIGMSAAALVAVGLVSLAFA